MTQPEKPAKNLPTYAAETTSAFKNAAQAKADLHVVMALTGPAGSGKTYTALSMAQALGDRVAVIDTESDSALLYRDMFNFDHVGLRKFLPQNYIKLIGDAITAKYDVLVIDSLSPSWNGKAGILEIAGGDFRGWKIAGPEYQSLIEALTMCRRKIHLICTLRAKTDYQVSMEGGKLAIRSLGLQPIHRDEAPYEFDIVANLSRDHVMSFEGGKSRYPDLDGHEFPNPGSDVAQIILNRINVLNSSSKAPQEP